MSGWNIRFDSAVAERVDVAVRGGKHLKGFSNAEDKLRALKAMLENLRFDADWWGGKCADAAKHYEAEQKALQSAPRDFAPDHAREAMSKSPQVLNEYAERLKAGSAALHEAIAVVDELSTKLKNAEADAKDASKRVSDMIGRAIELMESYARVRFD